MMPTPRRWPYPTAALALAVATGLALSSPPDRVQGDLVRIMYVHVPSAWLAYLAFLVTLVASVGYLVRRRSSWDRVAASSAEIGVLFTGLAIVLGMIWAKPTWGVWWTWDPRLTLTAIMFFVYLGYLALRRATADPRARARRAAVLGIVGALQIPLVHFSVTWWRSLHQPPSVIRPDGPQLDPPMLLALLAGVAAFTVAYVAAMVKRVELAVVEERIAEAERTLGLPVAGEAVTAPDLATEPGVGS